MLKQSYKVKYHYNCHLLHIKHEFYVPDKCFEFLFKAKRM